MPIHDVQRTPPPPAANAGRIVLPAFADPHVHLDKALTADRVANPAGDLNGAIAAWLAFRATQDVDAIRARARCGAHVLLAHGATAARAHVDTGPDIGLRAVEALTGLRAELAGALDIEVVACAALPLTGPGSAETRAIAAAALAAGADCLGGAPWLDDDPAGAYDALIALALAAGAGLDLHVDETLDPRVFTLPLLVERVEDGFPHPVTAAHAVSLGAQPAAVRARVAERLAAAGIGVVTLPATNLFLQGRGTGMPAARGLTALRELLDAGVALAAGCDNARDPFNPTGRLDPLETASLLVTAGHLSPEEALAAIARRDAPDHLVTLPASSPADAIAAGPSGRTVIRAGRVVAHTTVETWVHA